MSYARAGTPADLTEESWNLNSTIAHGHPFTPGLAITDKPARWCSYCGWQYEVKGSQCPECGCPNSTLLKANQRFSLAMRNSTAQSRRKVELCWAVEEDALTGDIKRHRLDEISVPVVDLTTKEFHKETRCRTCGVGYSRVEGRVASETELADAKAGKIAAPSKFLAGAGTNP